MKLKDRILIIALGTFPWLCLVSMAWAGSIRIIPLEDIVAQSERIVLAQVLTSENFDDGLKVFTRTHLRVLWDLTEAAGKGEEPDFADEELSVVEWTGIVGGVVYGLIPAIFFDNEVVVVCLRRYRDDGWAEYRDLVGEWDVVAGAQGMTGPMFRGGTHGNPMWEGEWQRLADHSAKVLTFLDVELRTAQLKTKRHFQELGIEQEPARKRLQNSPAISSISPDSVAAGTQDTVTIVGSNFGTDEGNVYLYLLGNEWAHVHEVPSWTDTLITFVPEHRMETGSFGTYSFPSSGRVYVKTASDDTVSSSQVLNIIFGNAHRWPDSSIPMVYRMNSSGTADCEGEFAAVEASFDTWQNIGGSYMAYERGADTTLTSIAVDGVNLVAWADLEDSSTIAVYAVVTEAGTNTITEVDLILNDLLHWTTTGETGRHDVRNVATHEIGHTLALADLYGSADSLKTMYGRPVPESTYQRDLTDDDISGAEFVYPALVSGSSADSHLWAGTIHVTGDVEIQSEDTLTVRPGTTVTFAADSDDQNSAPYTGKSALEVHGTLVAEGTSTNKITFKSDATSPEKGDWDGIIFWDSSVDASCKVNYSVIQHAQNGIYGYSATPAELNNNEISTCVSGIQGNFTSPTIQNNTLRDNNYGLYLYNVSGTGNGIQNNTIAENVAVGLYLSDCTVPIYGCTVRDNNRGVEIRAGTTSTLDSSRVDSSTYWGIYAYGSDTAPTLKSCTIAYNDTIGFRMFNGTTPDMDDPDNPNDFYSNGSYELFLRRECQPDLDDASSELNDIVPTGSGYAVYIDQSETFDTLRVRNNWWGSSDPDSTAIFSPEPYIIHSPLDTTENIPGTPKMVVDGVTVQLEQARELENAGELRAAAEIYRDVVVDYPDHPKTRRALSRLYTTWRNTGQDMLVFSELAGDVEQRATTPGMRRRARDWKLRSLLNAGRIAEALEGYRAIASPAPTSP